MSPIQTTLGQLIPAPLVGIDLLHVALAKGLSLMAVGWLGFRLVDVGGESIHRQLIPRLRGILAWPPAGPAMHGDGCDPTA